MTAKQAWLFGGPRRETPTPLLVAFYVMAGLCWLSYALVRGFHLAPLIIAAGYLAIGIAYWVNRSPYPRRRRERYREGRA